jgi:flagellar basal-body rod protein FlgG
MTIQTLYTAATGMNSLETKLDVIANNMANINTTGFKRDRANFEDLMYRNYKLPGTLDAANNPTPTGVKVGLGARVQSVQSEFRQGAMQQTGKPLDVAIEGNGFFEVNDVSGTIVYTRAGNFSINAAGQLVIGSAQTGRVLTAGITVPPDATNVSINSNGQVMVQQPGSQNLNAVGQLNISTFINPEGLLKLGENLYVNTDASGQALSNIPGVNGAGMLRSGSLEASNVEPVQELIDLITTQRAFELNSQIVQAGDQILQLVSNLRRF